MIDHNFGERSDGKFHILFSPKDAVELAVEAAMSILGTKFKWNLISFT